MPEVKVANRTAKTERILAKGDMMTWNEVLYLRERGLTQPEIAKAIGLPRQTFETHFRNWKKEMGL